MSKRIQQRLSISTVKASCKGSSISSKMQPLFISYEHRGYTVKLLGANFYSAILNKAKKGDSLTVVNDQVGTPTDVAHLAEFLLYMIKKEPEYGLYHFSDEQIMTWYDLAVAIVKEHQLEVSVAPSTTPR